MTEKKAQSKIIPFVKQMGQYAIAASVALVAIIGVNNYNKTQEVVDTAPLSVLNTRPLVGSVAPVSLQTTSQPVSAVSKDEQMLQQKLRINAYIQDHQLQQRLNTGMNMQDNNSDQNTPE